MTNDTSMQATLHRVPTTKKHAFYPAYNFKLMKLSACEGLSLLGTIAAEKSMLFIFQDNVCAQIRVEDGGYDEFQSSLKEDSIEFHWQEYEISMLIRYGVMSREQYVLELEKQRVAMAASQRANAIDNIKRTAQTLTPEERQAVIDAMLGK